MGKSEDIAECFSAGFLETLDAAAFSGFEELMKCLDLSDAPLTLGLYPG